MDADKVFVMDENVSAITDRIDESVKSIADRVDEIDKDIDIMNERQLRQHCRLLGMIGQVQIETIKRQRDEIDELRSDKNRAWNTFYDLQNKQFSAVKSLDEACEMLGIFVLDDYTISDKANLILQSMKSDGHEDDDADGKMTKAIMATCVCACLFFILVGISIIVSAVA